MPKDMPMPVHRDDARKFLYGGIALALLILVGVVGAIVQTGGALPARSYTYAKAAFENVGILKEGKEVRQHGIAVGTVSDIVYSQGVAIVTLRLDGDRPVYRDATAAVGNTSALGRKFVDLDPGAPEAGPLGDGTIPVSQTKQSQTLEDVLAALDPKTRKALKGALGELGPGLAGHGDNLNAALRAAPELLDDVRTVAAAAAGPNADLPGLLRAANDLVGRFENREAQLAGLLRNADATLGAVTVDNGTPLKQSVDVLPSTLREAQRALKDLNSPLRDAKVALISLEPGGKALGRSTATLRGFLRDSIGPLAKVPAVAGKATPAVDELTHTLADARPLVPRLSRTLFRANGLLTDFAPYAPDAGRFFSEHDLLSGRIAPDKHYFSAMLALPGLYGVRRTRPDLPVGALSGAGRDRLERRPFRR